jgi:hypothetical protein
MIGQTPRAPLITGLGGISTTSLLVYWLHTGRTPVARYRIEYTADAFYGWSVAGYVTATTISSYNFTITGLNPAKGYYVRVFALNNGSESIASALGYGYTLHPDVDAWRDEVITLDGADLMPITEVWTLNDSIINVLDANGYWSTIERFWVYNATSFNACRVCVKTLDTWTDTYSAEISAWTTNGFSFPTGVYIDTGFVPSTDATGGVNDFMMGYYGIGESLGMGIGDYGIMGAWATNTTCAQLYYSADIMNQYASATVYDKNNVSTTTSFEKSGLKTAWTDGSNVVLYDAGSAAAVQSFTASGLPNIPVYVGAVHTGGGTVAKENLEAKYINGFYFAYSLDSAGISKIHEVYGSYMQSQGL